MKYTPEHILTLRHSRRAKLNGNGIFDLIYTRRNVYPLSGQWWDNVEIIQASFGSSSAINEELSTYPQSLSPTVQDISTCLQGAVVCIAPGMPIPEGAVPLLIIVQKNRQNDRKMPRSKSLPRHPANITRQQYLETLNGEEKENQPIGQSDFRLSNELTKVKQIELTKVKQISTKVKQISTKVKRVEPGKKEKRHAAYWKSKKSPKPSQPKSTQESGSMNVSPRIKKFIYNPESTNQYNPYSGIGFFPNDSTEYDDSSLESTEILIHAG